MRKSACALLDAAPYDPPEGFEVLIESDLAREVSDMLVKSGDACAVYREGKTIMPGLIDQALNVTNTRGGGAVRRLARSLKK